MVTIEDVMKLELRVAEVLSAAVHPQADRLLILTVRIGEEERQIVAGIRQQYAPESLVGKKVVVIANLMPAVLRGVESQGMLLAASKDGAVVIITPEKDIPSGAVVK